MAAWLAWAIAAVLLSIGEIFTPGLFFLGPVALAAVAGAAAAALGAAVWLQLVIFIGGSVASVGFLRPIARAHLTCRRRSAPARRRSRARMPSCCSGSI